MGSINTPQREYTNPDIYAAHHKTFTSQPLPSSPSEWVTRAREVASILAQDAPQRDRENKSPAAEVSLLKSSGLLKVLGPKEFGGGGESWETGYKLIREVAKGDGSIGMLLGYHLLWSTTANVVGTEAQARGVQMAVVEENLVCLMKLLWLSRETWTNHGSHSSSVAPSTRATAI